MSFATLFPLGILQLFASVNHGYFAARQLSFITNPTNSVFEWLRLPGDLLFIIGGVLPFLYICWLGVRYRVGGATLELPEGVLFTEIVESTTAGAGDRER
jgi:nitric oxide reductase subunit B